MSDAGAEAEWKPVSRDLHGQCAHGSRGRIRVTLIDGRIYSEAEARGSIAYKYIHVEIPIDEGA